MKTIVSALFFLLPIFAFGQRFPTGKGTYRAGGGGSFSIADADGYYAYRLQVTPRLGYFVTDRLLTGFNLNYILEYDTVYTSAVKFSPTLKYFYPIKEYFFILGNFEVGVDRTTTFYDSKDIIDHSSITFGPGVSYFFSRRVGFEINILAQIYFENSGSYNNKVYTEGGLVLNLLRKNQVGKNPFKQRGDYELREEDDE